MKKIIAIILVILIILIVVFINNEEVEAPVTADEILETSTPTESPIQYTIEGTLEDVTGGKTIRGITTNNTSGVARAGYNDGVYIVNAEFTNLPDPIGDDFYEGWVVRQGVNFNFFSTGMLTKEVDGQYSNSWSTNENLLDYDFYVLTLEPNDGDPAPADHIVEGKMR